MTIGQKLKNLRTQNNMTQEALAESINVSRSAIAKWESDNGIPDINNLKCISQLFSISIDELLDNKINVEESVVIKKMHLSGYIGYVCDIELVGWNEGSCNALVLGEDEEFLFYQRVGKKKRKFGLLGKKFIKSIERISKEKSSEPYTNIDRNYFCNNHVLLEIACKEGLKGFFDFRNDDYLDVIILEFTKTNAILEFGKEININEIAKIEEK